MPESRQSDSDVSSFSSQRVKVNSRINDENVNEVVGNQGQIQRHELHPFMSEQCQSAAAGQARVRVAGPIMQGMI